MSALTAKVQSYDSGGMWFEALVFKFVLALFVFGSVFHATEHIEEMCSPIEIDSVIIGKPEKMQ